MSTTQQVNYVEIVKDIEDFYTDNSINVSALLTDTSLKYKPLSVKQLKTFIELQLAAAKDEFGVIPGLNAVDCLNNVIVDNSVDHKEQLMTSLSVLDRDAIILQLRSNVKPEAELSVTEDEDPVKINLTDIVKRIKKSKFPTTLRSKSKTIKYKTGSFTINLQLPSLDLDSRVNRKFKRSVVPTLKKGTKHVEKEADKILSHVYFLELYKYIDNVIIGKDSDKTTIDFRDLDNFDDNFMVLEKLPTQVVSAISSYMTSIREYKDSVFYWTNDEEKEIPLDVDIGLFAGI